MKKFVPLKLTQPLEDGEEPRDLGWKDLGPLRVLDVTQDKRGNVAMELGTRNTHVRLVATKQGGITVYRDDKELVDTA